jgi:hypothetical protein
MHDFPPPATLPDRPFFTGLKVRSASHPVYPVRHVTPCRRFVLSHQQPIRVLMGTHGYSPT